MTPKVTFYENQYQKAQNRALSYKEVYDLYHGQSLSWKEVCEKTGYSRNSVFRILRTFEAENPEMADQMKKKGRDVTPADYKQLQSEIARLQSELKREKLRADFYEEMVDFGKEVYGIDLKKAGTKLHNPPHTRSVSGGASRHQ